MEKLILKLLIDNEEYYKKIIGFLKSVYFKDFNYRNIFEIIQKYYLKYKKQISLDYIYMEIVDTILNEEIKNNLIETLETIRKFNVEETNIDYLIDKTEDYVKNVSIENAILESVEILKNEKKIEERITIPTKLRDALNISFKNLDVHNYLRDSEKRYDLLHTEEEKILTDIQVINKMTGGGFENKSLNCFMAGTNVGKTTVLSHLAGSFLIQNLDVLYITLEVSDIKISTRIDQNLFDISNTEIKTITKDFFNTKINEIINKTKGKLYVAEFPSAYATVDTIENLVEELEVKEKFKPKVVIIDYLTLLRSSTLSKIGDLYSFGKILSDEVRGFAVKRNLPVITALQVNRGGFNKLDINLNDIADSFAIAMNSDLTIAITQNEELDAQNKYLFKLIKTRNDVLKLYDNKALVGIDKSKQKLYNISNNTDDIKNIFKTNLMDDNSDEVISNMETFIKKGNRDFSKFRFN